MSIWCGSWQVRHCTCPFGSSLTGLPRGRIHDLRAGDRHERNRVIVAEVRCRATTRPVSLPPVSPCIAICPALIVLPIATVPSWQLRHSFDEPVRHARRRRHRRARVRRVGARADSVWFHSGAAGFALCGVWQKTQISVIVVDLTGPGPARRQVVLVGRRVTHHLRATPAAQASATAKRDEQRATGRVIARSFTYSNICTRRFAESATYTTSFDDGDARRQPELPVARRPIRRTPAAAGRRRRRSARRRSAPRRRRCGRRCRRRRPSACRSRPEPSPSRPNALSGRPSASNTCTRKFIVSVT